MNNINYRYNETKYAKEIEEKGFLTKYHVYELRILAKYYKSLGYKPKERKELIYQFCRKHIEDFEPVLYFKTINSVLNNAAKKESKMIDVGDIIVRHNEVAYIDSLNDLDLNERKILFTLLVMNKINKKIALIMYGSESKHNKFGGKSTQYRDLFKTAKIIAKNNINEIVHSLYKKEYITVDTIYKKDIGKIELTFLENIIEDGSENQKDIYINTFDNIGYYYDKYIGDEKIAECSECGILIRLNSNRKKYCASCWELKEKERKLKVWHNNKHKYKKN